MNLLQGLTALNAAMILVNEGIQESSWEKVAEGYTQLSTGYSVLNGDSSISPMMVAPMIKPKPSSDMNRPTMKEERTIQSIKLKGGPKTGLVSGPVNAKQNDVLKPFDNEDMIDPSIQATSKQVSDMIASEGLVEHRDGNINRKVVCPNCKEELNFASRIIKSKFSNNTSDIRCSKCKTEFNVPGI